MIVRVEVPRALARPIGKGISKQPFNLRARDQEPIADPNGGQALTANPVPDCLG
jgi:hypothetical protein